MAPRPIPAQEYAKKPVGYKAACALPREQGGFGDRVCPYRTRSMYCSCHYCGPIFLVELYVMLHADLKIILDVIHTNMEPNRGLLSVVEYPFSGSMFVGWV